MSEDALLRIESSPLRVALALLLGSLLGLGLVRLLFVEEAPGAFRWLAWAALAYLAYFLTEGVRHWRGAPFLVATREGLWLKHAECFGVIPWAEITEIGKVPLARAIELRLADRDKYLARVSFLRAGLALNLLLFKKVSLPLHLTGRNAGEVARTLRALWTEHR